MEKNQFKHDYKTVSLDYLIKDYNKEKNWLTKFADITPAYAAFILRNFSHDEYIRASSFVRSASYKFIRDTCGEKNKDMLFRLIMSSVGKDYYQLLPGISIAYSGKNSFKQQNGNQITLKKLKQCYNDELSWFTKNVGFSANDAQLLLNLKITEKSYEKMKSFVQSEIFKFFKDTLQAPHEILCSLFISNSRTFNRYRGSLNRFNDMMNTLNNFQILPGFTLESFQGNRFSVANRQTSYPAANLMAEYVYQMSWVMQKTGLSQVDAKRLLSTYSFLDYSNLKSFIKSPHYSFFKTTLKIQTKDILSLLTTDTTRQIKINEHCPEFSIKGSPTRQPYLLFNVQYPSLTLNEPVSQQFHFHTGSSGSSSDREVPGTELTQFKSDIDDMITSYDCVIEKVKRTHPNMSFSTYWDKLEAGITLALQDHKITASHPFYDFDKKDVRFKLTKVNTTNNETQSSHEDLLNLSNCFRRLTKDPIQ